VKPKEVYRREQWECRTCGLTGEVFIHKHDDAKKERQRIAQSHRSRLSDHFRACLAPDVVYVKKTQSP
jgi:hypothetical protein